MSRIASRIKSVLPADGTRACFYSYDSRLPENYEDTAPASELYWIQPLLGWACYVYSYRDSEEGYTEELELKGIVNQDSVAPIDEYHGESFMFYIAPNEQESEHECMLAARSKIKKEREIGKRRDEAFEQLRKLRELKPKNFSNRGYMDYWTCLNHPGNGGIEVHTNDGGLSTWKNGRNYCRCGCEIIGQIKDCLKKADAKIDYLGEEYQSCTIGCTCERHQKQEK